MLKRESMQPMAKIEKEDCLTVDQAAEKLGVSRATFYAYMNEVDAQRYRFRRDRHTYVSKRDLDRISVHTGKEVKD